MIHLLIGDLSIAQIEQSHEIHLFCSDLEAGMKCIHSYTLKCMNTKQREHFKSLYVGINMAIMELCQDGPYQDGKSNFSEKVTQQ